MKLNGSVHPTIKGVLALFGYHTCCFLGAGRFGTCYLVSRDEKVHVLKIFNRNDVKRRKEKLTLESRMLSSINHDSIPGLVQVIDRDGIYGLIMQKMPGDSLEALSIWDYNFSKKEILSIVKQLIDILEYLYALEISHRDIRASNILWQDDRLFLIDFGSARRLSHFPCRFNPDFWGVGDVFMRLALSSLEIGTSNQDLTVNGLSLSTSEKKTIKRLLHIDQPYHCVQDLKQDFENSFNLNCENE